MYVVCTTYLSLPTRSFADIHTCVSSVMKFLWWWAQFYIQLLCKPHLETWILLFGPFGQLLAVREKNVSIILKYATFEGGFFTFSRAKNKCIFHKNLHCSVRTKKLINISIFYLFFCLKIGYHSVFKSRRQSGVMVFRQCNDFHSIILIFGKKYCFLWPTMKKLS